MNDLQLHPTAILTPLRSATPGASPDLPAAITHGFADDWRAGLILLAGSKLESSELSLGCRYWRHFGATYLAGLCHQLDGTDFRRLPHPSPSTLERTVSAAPPIPGGEYLTPEALTTIWDHLNAWVAIQLEELGSVGEFLEVWAPTWQRVGKVTFHLAENKQGAERPFAFLATFATGIGADGRHQHTPLREALKLYAGTNNRAALIKLLTPVEAAADRLEWVREMVNSGSLYKPAAWTVEQAHRFFQSLEEMDAAGLMVQVPDWWSEGPRARVQVSLDSKSSGMFGEGSLLHMDVRLMLGDDELTEAEIREILASRENMIRLKGRWVDVDRDRITALLDHWNGVAEETEEAGLSFQEGLRLLAGASTDLQPGADTDAHWAEFVAGRHLQDLVSRLRDPSGGTMPRLAAGLKRTLRPYQRDGVAWLNLLCGLGFGACLADDMGLGKTLQVLALLSARKKSTSLLVVPASLLGNWQAEARKFAPKLRLLFLHASLTGKDEMAVIAADPDAALADRDLVITTYSMVTRLPWLAERPWDLVILDEAQAIKNARTRQSKAVRKLRGAARIALTGTPVENRLGDLWSLFDFLNPGLLGSAKVFKSFTARLEEDGFEPLRRLVGPFILRRLKTDRKVIADLPEKTETRSYCNLTRPQVRLYAKVVEDLARSLKATIDDPMQRRGLVLGALMRLKQVCNHPDQLSGTGAYAANASGKFLRLAEICDELAQRQEKALVFTQYREIIPALEDHLAGVFGRPGLVLHGGTGVKKRAALVQDFQEPGGPPFFVISLKAGGTGLNLTEACHVIHFDRWWNPAVENQATDRAFRIGQQRNVMVHKFVTLGTVEEKIDNMIESKKALAEQVLEGENIRVTEMSDEELLALVRLDINQI